MRIRFLFLQITLVSALIFIVNDHLHFSMIYQIICASIASVSCFTWLGLSLNWLYKENKRQKNGDVKQ